MLLESDNKLKEQQLKVSKENSRCSSQRNLSGNDQDRKSGRF